MHVNFGLVPPLPEPCSRQARALRGLRERGLRPTWRPGSPSSADLFGPEARRWLMSIRTADELVDRYPDAPRSRARRHHRSTVRAYSADLAALPRVGRALGRRPDRAHAPPDAPVPGRDSTARATRAAPIARRLSAVRSFFAYLVAEGLVASDPSRCSRRPSYPRGFPTVIPDDALAALLDAPDVEHADRPARPGGPRAAVRDGRACQRGGRPAHRRPRLRARSGPVVRQGLQGAHRARATRWRSRVCATTCATVGPSSSRATSGRPPLPLVARPAALLGCCTPALQAIHCQVGAAQSRFAALDAPHVRHAPGRSGGGSADSSGATGPCCPVYHPDLYSPEHEAASRRSQ